MIEIFVIYNKHSGRIEGGAGRVNRGWDRDNRDGSTMSERIEKILAKHPDYDVVFLPDGDLPDLDVCAVINGQVVEPPENERPKELSAQERERKIFSEMRSLATQSLVDKGEL